MKIAKQDKVAGCLVMNFEWHSCTRHDARWMHGTAVPGQDIQGIKRKLITEWSTVVVQKVMRMLDQEADGGGIMLRQCPPSRK